MRVLPHVTVVGEITGGALGTMYEDPMPNGWNLVVSFKTARDHEGVCWDGIGVPPDLRMINTNADIVAGQDKVLEFAVKLLQSGELVSHEDTRSLETIKLSLVEAYLEAAESHGLEIARDSLKRAIARQDEGYYFAADEVFTNAGRLFNLGKIDEIIELLKVCIETYPEVAGAYSMLAFAYLNSGDIDAAKAVIDDARNIEVMYSFESPMLERVKRALENDEQGDQ
jgi:tetratricopeptide (TPR) repeat protein